MSIENRFMQSTFPPSRGWNLSTGEIDKEISKELKSSNLCPPPRYEDVPDHMAGGGVMFSNCRNCSKVGVECNDPLWFSRPNPDVVAGVYDGTASRRGPVNLPIDSLFNDGLNSVDELIRQPLDVQQQYYWDFVPASGSWSSSEWPTSSYSTDVWF